MRECDPPAAGVITYRLGDSAFRITHSSRLCRMGESADQGITVFPPPWSREGQDLSIATRAPAGYEQSGTTLLVRSLYYDGMVRVVVTPTWVKLIDVETTPPSAVEELIRQREERQGA